MASPPAAAVDLRKHGQYTLKVGKSLKSGTKSTSFSGVKYNHKPSLSNGSRTTKLSRASDGDATLSIKDNEDGSKTSRYSYKGRRSSSKSSYVLIFDSETQSCTLEPVDSTYNFNLTSAPWETSQDKMARQYEQLRTEETVSRGHEDEDVDGEPDANNPFDFRHYLNINSRPSPSPSPGLKPTSTAKTSNSSSTKPVSNTKSTAPKTQSKPANKVDPLRQAPRKQKTANTSTGKADQRPTPTVRLDRRASTRPGDPPEKKVSKPSRAAPASKGNFKSDAIVHASDDEDDDIIEAPQSVSIDESGGLEIDWGTEKPKRRPAPARALDLTDDSQDGPISLHSAANSPAGRMAPRQARKQRQDYEQDVIDFGTPEDDQGIEEDGISHVAQHTATDEDTHMDDAGGAESDGDADVEPMELGSPAHLQQQAVADEQEDEADFDDDLEAQMMAAMEQDDEQGVDDESDVSEAE